jgi:hypothetical protein
VLSLSGKLALPGRLPLFGKAPYLERLSLSGKLALPGRQPLPGKAFSVPGRAVPFWKTGSTWKTISAWKGFLNIWKGWPYLEIWLYLEDCLERLSQYLESCPYLNIWLYLEDFLFLEKAFSIPGRAVPIWKSGSTWKSCLCLERFSQYLEGLALSGNLALPGRLPLPGKAFSIPGRAGPIWKSGSTWKTASFWKGFLNTWKGGPRVRTAPTPLWLQGRHCDNVITFGRFRSSTYHSLRLRRLTEQNEFY